MKVKATLSEKSLEITVMVSVVMIFVLADKDGYRADYEDAEKKFKEKQ